MPMVLRCDGCLCDLPREDAQERGRLSKAFYCSDCASTLDQAEAEIEAARVELITAFETDRTARLAVVRKTLKRLPDA